MRYLDFLRKLNFLFAAAFLLVGAMEIPVRPSTSISQQDYPDGMTTYVTNFVIVGDKPSEFQDFDQFVLEGPDGKDPDELQADKNGNIRLTGYLTTNAKRKFAFRSSMLFKDNRGGFEKLIFTTKQVDGTYYKFSGNFLARPVQDVKSGPYIALRGILSKYTQGRRVASAKLSFATYGIL